MSSVGTELAQIAEIEIPGMSDDFPDTLTVQQSNESQGADGGTISGTPTSYKTAVPCVYEPITRGSARIQTGDRITSVQQYMITMPTHHSGARIDLNPKTHRLIIDARGNEPSKAFKIISVKDQMGVLFECVSEREN